MVEFLQDVGHHRNEVLDPVAHRLHRNDGDGECRKVLLELQVPVHRQEHIELRGSQREQLAVRDA